MSLDELLETIRRESVAEVIIPQARIAEAYGITRQGLHRLVTRNDIPADILDDPCAVLAFLLDNANRSPFRTRLLDENFRLKIGLRIDEIHFEIYQTRQARILKRYEKQLAELSLPVLGTGPFTSTISEPK